MTPPPDADLAALFVARSRYYLATEYPGKLRLALEAIPPDRLWWRPAPGANSAGNLVLHLAGNVRQWIVAGVGGHPDVRDRDGEFAAAGGLDHALLGATLEAACRDADAVLATLDADALRRPCTIQGRATTVFAAVYHVVEHFAGHTGQVIQLAKWCAPGALCFYDDAGGLARPLFLPDGVRDQ